MKINHLKSTGCCVLLAAAIFALGGTAAMAGPCATTDLTTSTACEKGQTKQDSQAQVNSDALFGISNWVFLAKSDSGVKSGDPYNLSYAGSTGGTWLMDNTDQNWVNPWSTYGSLMLVMKDGNDTLYTGYLLLSDVISGTWSTLTVFDGKELSHMTLYGTTTKPPQEVPEPGTLALLGLGLAGMGFARRRRS